MIRVGRPIERRIIRCMHKSLHSVASPNTLLVASLNILENLNFHLGCLSVLWDALYDFDRDVLLLCPIPALRHLAKGAFANDLQDLVARQQRIPQINNVMTILVVPLDVDPHAAALAAAGTCARAGFA
jgi:hypothetical protein